MRMGWRNEKEQAERDRLMSWKIENHLKTHLFLEFKSKQNNSAFRCKFVYHIKIEENFRFKLLSSIQTEAENLEWNTFSGKFFSFNFTFY